MSVRERGPSPGLRVLMVAFAAFVMLGLVDGALGVAWPSISDAFSRSISDLGILLVSGGAGYLTATLLYGWAHSRFGTGSLLIVGSVLMAAGLAGMALAPLWVLMVSAPFVVGVGGGLVDTGMNAHAALAFDNRSMNILHACFGVGATLGPIVLTMSLTTTGAWRLGYAVLAIVQVAIGVAVWSRRHRWAEESAVDHEQPIVARRRRRSAFLIVVFLIYTGVEIGTGQWAFTLLSESRGMSTAAAGAFVSAYWAGLTVGRFGVGAIGARWRPTVILRWAPLVGVAGLLILWSDPGGLGAIGLPLTGLGLAPIFPTLVSVTPQRIGRDRSTSAIGYQFAAATIGGSAIPWIIGLAAASAGLDMLATGLLVAGVLLAVVMMVSEREARAPSPSRS